MDRILFVIGIRLEDMTSALVPYLCRQLLDESDAEGKYLVYAPFAKPSDFESALPGMDVGFRNIINEHHSVETS